MPDPFTRCHGQEDHDMKWVVKSEQNATILKISLLLVSTLKVVAHLT
jgi:hypothetical protein